MNTVYTLLIQQAKRTGETNRLRTMAKMAKEDWRAEAARQADEKCDRFLLDVNELIIAGLPGADPAFALHDWPQHPSEMNVSDILEYVHRRYGELFLGFCRSIEQLRTH